ncbi:MAG: hypothetical protein DLM69_08365, partial [Candidatus Chloroheliales bacterium]
IMPGLAPTDDKTYPANESDLLFLQDMYDAGAKDYFDIASVMIYGFQEPPTTHRTDFNRFNFSRPILTHELMVRNGDGNKPIWGSEYAWLSLSPNIDWPPDPRYGNQKSLWGNGVDEQTQGEWLVGGYERARRDWPWMGVMAVWKFRDPINNPTLPASWFSIVNNDFSPRPAYNILHDYARTGAWGTVADVGVHSGCCRAITWQGNWNKSATPVSGNKGDALSISSIGDALRLRVNVPLHYQVAGGSSGDISPSDGVVDIALGDSSAYSHTVTTQMLADNAQVAGFTVYRNQPFLLAAGIPAAYIVSTVGLGVAAYRLLPWLVYLLDRLFQYLLFAFTRLLFALRWLGRAILSLLGRLAFTFIYLSLPRNTVSPAVTSRYLPKSLQSTIYNLQSTIIAPIGLILSVALFYLPVTRAELLSDINPLPLIIGGLMTAFFALLTPETALALIIALVPLYLQPGYLDIGFMEIGWGPKYIGHFYFPIAELLLLLTAAVVGWRIAVGWLVGRLAPVGWRTEDRAQTTVVRAVRTPLTQVMQYLRADAFALLGILWVALGGFSLLTVADRQFLSDSVRELRWTVIEPVLFYFLYVYVVGRMDPHPTSPNGGGVLPTPLPPGGAAMTPLPPGGAGGGSVPPEPLPHPASPFGGGVLPKMFPLFDFFIGAAVIVSIFGIVQFFFGTNTVNVENLSRVTSVYEHPNSLALYLGRALPIAVAFAVLLPAAYRQRRIIYALTAVIIGITMYLTYSRGALLGVGGALVVIALLGGWGVIARLWQSRRGIVVAMGGLALVIGAAAIYFALARLTDLGSVSLRRDIWSAALHMIKDHPIFGVGLDQFANQYPHYATAAVQAVGEVYTSHPHNFLLDYWLRLGIIGLLLGGLTIFLFYRFGWWLWRLTRNPLHRAILVALLASMTDFVLHGLVDQAYFVPDLALIFWFTLASMEATRRSVLDET